MPSEQCPRAHSDMTPCIVKHGDSARLEDGSCVGCGEQVVVTNPPLNLDAIEATAAGMVVAMPHNGTAHDALALVAALRASRAEVERLRKVIEDIGEYARAAYAEAAMRDHAGRSALNAIVNTARQTISKLKEVEK